MPYGSGVDHPHDVQHSNALHLVRSREPSRRRIHTRYATTTLRGSHQLKRFSQSVVRSLQMFFQLFCFHHLARNDASSPAMNVAPGKPIASESDVKCLRSSQGAIHQRAQTARKEWRSRAIAPTLLRRGQRVPRFQRWLFQHPPKTPSKTCPIEHD
jgi:hypothetical protein